ncbi:signal-regulatory protein beta-2-like [Archocentrus centrarchus]|uniref:signal-regulatory protein beta-2-like n=1 Tax=Archocentrus centrarchus TaxID=63155 RepID=UPI0011E9C586|nr:signal-regulatory protein beta-2-like [Archocentrus centrarchus]
MIVLWIIFFCLQQAYSLVPVKTVQLGEPATLTCALPKELSSRGVNWYKQSVGDTLKLIATLYKSTSDYGPGFSSTRIQVHKDKNFTSLTILKTVQEDEALYHCANTEWIGTTWSGTYLLIKGDTQGVSNYTVSQLLIEMNPVHPGDTMTLQCSVFSDSENKTCPGDLNVLWFRAGSNKSHPNIIYADRNRRNEYETRSETQQSCVFRFSKNVSSSDAGTYYCAVATCGEILFGNGTTLDIQVPSTQSSFIHMAILIVCLAISAIGNVFLICNQRLYKQFKGTESAISDTQTETSHQPTEALNYAALNFSERKTRGRRKREFAEDSVYSQVAC